MRLLTGVFCTLLLAYLGVHKSFQFSSHLGRQLIDVKVKVFLIADLVLRDNLPHVVIIIWRQLCFYKFGQLLFLVVGQRCNRSYGLGFGSAAGRVALVLWVLFRAQAIARGLLLTLLQVVVLELIRLMVDQRADRVVQHRVTKHLQHVRVELRKRLVHPPVHVLLYRREVHGLLDNSGVVGDVEGDGVDGVEEGF